jgi:beta-fructofuranosidase
VFTGSLVPTSTTGGPGLSIFYTSASALPIHWTKTHIRGSEGVALVTSTDGYDCKPDLRQALTIGKKQGLVVEREPEDLAVTGFRDPFLNPWPAMDRSLGKSTPGLYALLSGGIQEGPCLFLYDIDVNDMTRWTFLRTLGQTPRNAPIGKWTGQVGTNWECACIFTLSAEGEWRDVCIFGVEGGSPAEHAISHAKANPKRPVRGARYAPWLFVNVENGDMAWKTAGQVDWAEFYAVSTFAHPDGRRIAWGWIVEEDLSPELAEEKGWMGCLGMPRELSLQVYDGVIGTSGSTLEDVGSFDVKGERVVTLGVAPLAELTQLRGSAVSVQKPMVAPECYEIELEASMTFTSTITLFLRHTPDYSISTSISFSPDSEQIIISRGHSTQNIGVCTRDEIAPFALLHFADRVEPVSWRVFVDRDVLEVFCNGRVAFATRLYSPKEANMVSIEVEDGAEVVSATMWEMGSIGLVNA